MNTIIAELTENGEEIYDIFCKLADSRIIFISGYIDDKIAADVVANLLFFDAEDVAQKVSIYLNADGGDIRSVLMIYDIMKIVKCPLEIICIGTAFYESLLLVSSGTKGLRFATRNAKFCLSNVMTEEPSKADMITAKIMIDQIRKDNLQFLDAISKGTGQTISKITKDAEKKLYLNANEARKYGIIDSVISRLKK